jgi:hypothetical protein
MGGRLGKDTIHEEGAAALIVTTINEPTDAVRELAAGCLRLGLDFYVIGDKKSPRKFFCEGVTYFDLKRQLASDLIYAHTCPTGHYARKNIGYLLAIAAGAKKIIETDDDNFPLPNFWTERKSRLTVPSVRKTGWLNVYKYFSSSLIWPRGLPLNEVNAAIPDYEKLVTELNYCPIQQGLANNNPDVDAIYRLLLPLPQSFLTDRKISLKNGVWCPFNSQNTTWWNESFPLLYLPAYCSFRMTDIWRSFVAQRIAWEADWAILFHEPSVYQERNEHNLMRDFSDEIEGYVNNAKIADVLSSISLKSGAESIIDNMLICYETLVSHKLIDVRELGLLEQWLADLHAVGYQSETVALIEAVKR